MNGRDALVVQPHREFAIHPLAASARAVEGDVEAVEFLHEL
jgi:hypothetical protein